MMSIRKFRGRFERPARWACLDRLVSPHHRSTGADSAQAQSSCSSTAIDSGPRVDGESLRRSASDEHDYQSGQAESAIRLLRHRSLLEVETRWMMAAGLPTRAIARHLGCSRHFLAAEDMSNAQEAANDIA